MYGCGTWTSKNWCFWTEVLEKTLESPLDCKEIQPVHPKENQSSEEHRKCPYIPALPTAWSSGSKDCIHCHNPDIQHHASTPEACSMNTQQRQCLPAVARILISLSTQHLEPVCVKQTLFYCFIALSPPPTAVSWMSSQVPEHPSKHS